MILLTGNRNLKDPDSLEQTIREENTPFSLPVITIVIRKSSSILTTGIVV
jgi:hypothetical protein